LQRETNHDRTKHVACLVLGPFSRYRFLRTYFAKFEGPKPLTEDAGKDIVEGWN